MVIRRLFVLAVAAALPLAAHATSENAPAMDFGALCDSLAGNANDTDYTGPGIAYDDINASAAERACRSAIEDRPDERRYFYEFGRVLEKKGDADGAIAAYEKAAGMGSMVALVDGLGLMYENGDGVDQDYQKAADYYRQAADAGSVAGMGALAYLYDFGLLDDNGAIAAAKLYEKQIAVADDPYAKINLAVILEGGRTGVEKDIARAERLLRSAVASGNADAASEAQNSLAFLLAETNHNLDEAETLASAAIDAAGDDDVGKATALDTRAWVRHAAGRDAEAVADAEEAVKLDEEPEYLNRLGDIYAALGRTAEAKDAWQKALSLPPPNAYYEPEWDPVAIQAKIDAAG